MLQPCVQGMLEVRSSTKAARAYKIRRPLNSAGVGRNRSGLEDLCLAVK